MRCKRCSKEFHACSSCGLEFDWEHDYCSEKCYLDSTEFHDRKNNVWVASKIESENMENIVSLFWIFDEMDINIADFIHLIKYVQKD